MRTQVPRVPSNLGHMLPLPRENGLILRHRSTKETPHVSRRRPDGSLGITSSMALSLSHASRPSSKMTKSFDRGRGNASHRTTSRHLAGTVAPSALTVRGFRRSHHDVSSLMNDRPIAAIVVPSSAKTNPLDTGPINHPAQPTATRRLTPETSGQQHLPLAAAGQGLSFLEPPLDTWTPGSGPRPGARPHSTHQLR